MVRVPRCGTHHGIKYNKKWSRITFCDICNNVIFKPTRGKKYCNICSINKDREHKRRYASEVDIPSRDKEEERVRWRTSKQGKIRKSSSTTNYIPGSLKDKEDIDWDEEARKIQKLKKATYSDSYMHKYEYYD